VRFLGVDLAWGEGTALRPANRSGAVTLEQDGTISDAGWTVGLDKTLAWIRRHGDAADVLLFVDAPLVVANPSGQRRCERQVGQRYGRFKVSANSTNLASPRKAGVHLREALQRDGWRYDAGIAGPPETGRVISECYPYTTIVGAAELGYDEERPPYKRAARGMAASEAWARRTAACDGLIARVAALRDQDPPIDLRSHPATRNLIDIPSPASAGAYKQREDLLDASLCAWTAALWHRHGLSRCQVLGADDTPDQGGRIATIIAPARDEQRPAGQDQ
jgi:predicted RNase H-like nuclease